MTDPTVTLPIWAPLVGVGSLVWLAVMARYRKCSCEKCSFHVNEARLDREKNRAKNHRSQHVWWGGIVPWGDKACPDCRAGHEDDRDQKG